MKMQSATAVQGDMGAVADLIHGRNGDPFSLLGMHVTPEGPVIRSFQPGALGVQVLDPTGKARGDLAPIHPDGLFGGKVAIRDRYRLRVEWRDGPSIIEDPYSFGLLLGELDLHLIAEGRHRSLGRCLGAHIMSISGVNGARFAVWAPNARRVSIVGDFNHWDGRRHPMRRRVEAGVWELFVPGLPVGARYKYEILGQNGQLLPLKADPCGAAAEHPPATASSVSPAIAYDVQDEQWQQTRRRSIAPDAPVSIYEVHPGSWMRAGDGGYLSWHDLADRLVPYASEMGFTHIELMPITEHPFDGSWGYQPIGLFAPTARFGPPEGLAHFVDRAHAAGLGLILDWVPGHFPTDPHGLARFDGTALYEHADRREGFHHDWNTLIYNFGRHEVRGFLIASALHWLADRHCDGLRVDAVASMLYRDYSRPAGEWIPNVHGGRENLEAVGFLRELTREVRERAPGAVTIAEESTAWPGVSAGESEGGLGFDYKWNMGWMHDTLSYMSRDPVHRRHHHGDITFGLSYAFSERFILPLSHDEVVHGKGSLLAKMPGDRWQRFANLRGYFAFMWAHPGKKLLFMGGEFAQPGEWSHDRSLDWHLLDDPMHRGVQRLIRDLNRLYATMRSLHERDCRHDGFRWVVGDDTDNSVFAFLRLGASGETPVLVVCNFTPVAREGYRIGVPFAGAWRECLNTDATTYGGGGIGNLGAVATQKKELHGYPQSVALRLPPLGVLMLVPDTR